MGLAYLAPEVALVFKAKWVRAKDESDFAAVGIAYPGHHWLSQL